MTPVESLEQLSKLEIAGICSTLGGLAGALSFGLKVEEGKRFKLSEFTLHVCTSAFCGFLTYEFLDYAGFPPGIASAACGLSGWMGTRLIRILEIVIRKRLGVTPDDIKESKNE